MIPTRLCIEVARLPGRVFILTIANYLIVVFDLVVENQQRDISFMK